MRLRSGDKHHLRKSADRKAQIRKAFVPFIELFPIVFGINLIHFFDEKKDGAADRLFRFDPLSRHLKEAKRRTQTVSKSATFWQRKV